MEAPITTIVLIVLTLMSAWTWVDEFFLWRKQRKQEAQNWEPQNASDPSRRTRPWWLMRFAALGCMLLFIFRAIFVHHAWQPLQAHVDGLLLLAAMLMVTMIYLQNRKGLWNVGLFGLPLVFVILLWSICASNWTFHPFTLNSVWNNAHLASVYVGTLFSSLSAIAGVMFLYVQYRLRHKADPTMIGRGASLERLESMIIFSASLGFGLLTLGLATGVIIYSENHQALRTAHLSLMSPKVILSLVAWVIYALLINVRHGSRFRGAQAAWMSIAALVLLLAVFGIVNRMAHDAAEASPQTQQSMIQSNYFFESHHQLNCDEQFAAIITSSMEARS